MARADTEPTQARKKAPAVLPTTEPAVNGTAPEAAPKPAKRRRFRLPELSEEMIGMIFVAAIVLCATIIWVILALLS